MPLCPQCGSNLSDDFGLVNCLQCQAALFVEMDGEVKAQEAHELEASPQDEPFENPSEVQKEAAVDEGVLGEEGDQTQSEFQKLSTEATGESQSEWDTSDPSEWDEPAQSEPPHQSSPSAPDLGDIEDFGNSNQSLGQDGMLRFNIKISGIDSNDIREELKAALDDQKFVWDIEALLRSINNGELVIEEVTPVKSALLVSRIRSLPVKIYWEQYAIHQN